MPKFKVLRPIEHSQRLYVPAAAVAPEKIKSAAHGGDIEVDATGEIELTDAEAAPLNRGQVERIDAASAVAIPHAAAGSAGPPTAKGSKP
ncbi:MAG TPA: hypothetical protein VKU44_10670 [Terriglobia bacterium]|nr:hypothetical protein [Terriglobia bacterium]